MVSQVLHFKPDDTLLGSLPFFHSFGYTMTLWMPLLKGISTVYVPDPLDAGKVGEMAGKYGASILFGTPTFFNHYTRRCSQDQFRHLRIAVAGAEKLREGIAAAFTDKFGVPVAEGYGATEMAPVVSCNAPDFMEKGVTQQGTKAGSVGIPLPGLTAKVVDADDLDRELPPGEEGMLLLKGPNRMIGYLKDRERTEEVLHRGWYITGDIARVDEKGFIHIAGRLSRFSKIGGEMVPHIRIEEAINRELGFEEPRVVVTSVSDEAKGEKLVALHLPDATPHIDPKAVMQTLRKAGLPNLWIPREFHETKAFPVLATGKLDLKGLGRMAAELSGLDRAS